MDTLNVDVALWANQDLTTEYGCKFLEIFGQLVKDRTPHCPIKDSDFLWTVVENIFASRLVYKSRPQNGIKAKRKNLHTGPTGIPKAVLSSSDKSPGFFSFSFVSNSLPCKIN